MKKPNRLLAFLAIVSMALTQASCGPPIASLRGAISAFAPLITVLVSQGKITQAKADQYTRDANKLLTDVGTLQDDWKAATSKADKAVAIQKFANSVSTVAADFAPVVQLTEAMAILNTALAVIEAFYSPTPTARPGQPKTEKELADYVKTQSARMKQALQPRH